VLGYRDVRCLLELEFLYNVKLLDICEEFLLCGSRSECQVVRLNFDDVCINEVTDRETDPGATPFRLKTSFGKFVRNEDSSLGTSGQKQEGQDELNESLKDSDCDTRKKSISRQTVVEGPQHLVYTRSRRNTDRGSGYKELLQSDNNEQEMLGICPVSVEFEGE